MAVFVDYALPTNAQGNRPVLSLPRPARRREPLDKELTLDQLRRIVLEMQDALVDLNWRESQLPFGGPVSYLKNVPFVNGVSLVLPHLMDIRPATGATGAGLAQTSTTTQVRALIAHKNAFGDVLVVSSDERNITLLSNANLTADVLLWVVP